MYLNDLLTSCLRRWYLLMPCLLVAAAVLLVASQMVHPTYEAKANIVLVPPRNPDDPNLNRYMALGGMQESADVLARSLSSQETTEVIAKAVPGAEFEVAMDASTSAPILTVDARSSRRTLAARMLRVVLDRIPENLTTLQEEVDIQPANRITTLVLSRDGVPEPVQKARIRVLGALAAFMLLGTAMFVGAADGWMLRRRSSPRVLAERVRADGQQSVH